MEREGRAEEKEWRGGGGGRGRENYITGSAVQITSFLLSTEQS